MVSKHHFSGAATGHIPTNVGTMEATIMGKPADPAVLAGCIGRGLENSHIDLVGAAMESKAVHAIRATPGGGLTPKGDEATVYKYDATKNEPMFGGAGPS